MILINPNKQKNMKKSISDIKSKYKNLGIVEKHIDYAIDQVNNKVKREYIYKNLTSDVRKVSSSLANEMLDELIERSQNPLLKILKPFLISLLLVIAAFLLLFIGLDNRVSAVASIPAIIFFFKGVKEIMAAIFKKK